MAEVIADNRNEQYFEVREEYSHSIELDEILQLKATAHFEYERQERMKIVRSCLDKDDYIEKVFIVDTGSIEGCELHCITHSGIIFILNEDKYHYGEPCLVTIKIARVKQLEKYPYAFSKETLEKCRQHQKDNLNQR